MKNMTMTKTSIEKKLGVKLNAIGVKFVSALNSDLKAGKKLNDVLNEFYSLETFTSFDENLTVIISALKVANDLSGTRKYKDVLAFLNAGAKKPLALYNMVQSIDFIKATEVNQKRLGTKALKANENSENIQDDFSELLAEKKTAQKSINDNNNIDTTTAPKAMSQAQIDTAYADLLAKLSTMVPDQKMVNALTKIVKGA